MSHSVRVDHGAHVAATDALSVPSGQGAGLQGPGDGGGEQQFAEAGQRVSREDFIWLIVTTDN